MKKIQALNGFWLNGAFVAAEYFRIRIIYDDLETIANFYYEFLSDNKTVLGNGNFEITGETYQNWDGSNNFVWSFAVEIFGLILDETK